MTILTLWRKQSEIFCKKKSFVRFPYAFIIPKAFLLSDTLVLNHGERISSSCGERLWSKQRLKESGRAWKKLWSRVFTSWSHGWPACPDPTISFFLHAGTFRPYIHVNVQWFWFALFIYSFLVLIWAMHVTGGWDR